MRSLDLLTIGSPGMKVFGVSPVNYSDSVGAFVWINMVSNKAFTAEVLNFLDILNACFIYEPCCEKTSLRGFRPGPTQTRLYNHSRWLEA